MGDPGRKWRKQLVLRQVAACQETALPEAQTTLAARHTDGDVPQIPRIRC